VDLATLPISPALPKPWILNIAAKHSFEAQQTIVLALGKKLHVVTELLQLSKQS
jgi:hypothetical protein